MNFLDVVSLVEDAYNMIQTMKADGTLSSLEAAEKAVETELANPNVQALITKLKSIQL